jgi:hypothetical protein
VTKSPPPSKSRLARALSVSLALGAASVAVASSCKVDLGDMPARCSSADKTGSACPTGYECIHDVCARPGTPIPATLTSLQYLRPFDLRVVPQSNGVLVVWQIYRYDIQLHDFGGVRIGPDGTPSAPMLYVTQYPANADYLEPYFDVLGVSDTELLMTMGAAPADDSPLPRLTQFAVHLPPVGSEAKGASFEKRWEKRLRTIGYGAVSQPRLLRSSQGVDLGYFESFVTSNDTLGGLASFRLADDGTPVSPPACSDASCCQANDCFQARAGLPVAISVWDGYVSGSNLWWMLDDTRPSFVRQTLGTPSKFVEGNLPRLALPLEADDAKLTFLQPSARAGNGLPDDPVSGGASLWSLAIDAQGMVGSPTKIADLPGIRDTPRPAWIHRANKPALLITPGTDESADALSIYTVDTSSGATAKVATIQRFSTVPVGAVRGAIVGGKLYVVWLDASSDAATVRATVVPEP